MSGRDEKLNQKWNIVKEELIALVVLNKLPKGNDEFRKLLHEDIELKNLNSQNFNSLCYYILGIINCEERDKLIQWPLINIQRNTKFRKGVAIMINNFQDKYPWSHIKKLPESYFMNPHGHQVRIVDFLLRLTNLAIHIALDDPELLLMHSGDGLNSGEIAIMTEIISKAHEKEEKIMRNDVLPLSEIEDAKNEIGDKCIALRQKNDDLQQQLNYLKKLAVSEKFVPDKKDIDINDLKDVRNKKFIELNTLNEDLLDYFKTSKELFLKIKALKNPSSLSSKDFGSENSSFDLAVATARVCGDLCQFFQYITSINCTEEQKNEFFRKLTIVKQTMKEQNETLHLFLDNILSKQEV